ncbi:MAG: DUF2807 domain-containing protein [Acidimicrobiia bacterium]|nr:DUF2807 domain-containing protein [Acidimicrobiia bacterium]
MAARSGRPGRSWYGGSFPVFAALVGLLGAACGDITTSDAERGSGEQSTDTRSVGAFERVVLAGEGQVLFATGPDGFIEIVTDDNLVEFIETDVSGSTLTISTEQNVDIDPTADVIYRLGCPELTEVVLTGAGSIDLAGCATTAELELELTGAGSIMAKDLNVSRVHASVPGVGSIVASGTTDRLDVVLAGAGDFEGADLQATDADVESLGVGQVTVWATDNLDIELLGVGQVRYYGQPAVEETIAGVGRVESLGPK